MKQKEAVYLTLRYATLLVLGLFIEVFYIIFKPLTIYPVYFILKLTNHAYLLYSTIIIGKTHIGLISACIGGAAYYLLLILLMATPMELQKRIKAILFSFICFLVVNNIRILILVWLVINGSNYFTFVHEITWYLGSTLLVIIIWFATIYLFKIKNIPGYTDFKVLVKAAKRNKK